MKKHSSKAQFKVFFIMNLVVRVRGNFSYESETILPSSLVPVVLSTVYVFVYLVLILHSSIIFLTLDNFGLCVKVKEVKFFCLERSEIFVVNECIH